MMPPPESMWVFYAAPIKVIDGDTIDAIIDHGMHGYRKERLRLLDVNAPERKGVTLVAGNASRAYVAQWLGIMIGTPDHTIMFNTKEPPLVVQTYESDVFGRFLALIWRVSDGACLNDDLVRDGMARVDIR